MVEDGKLSASMSLDQFDNGYWYASELKDFAKSIGIAHAGGLRKGELEECIRKFLGTGKVDPRKKKTFSVPKPMKDVDIGLRLDLPVTAYTNDATTKEFLEKEAQKLAPGLKRKSGARYRLNRWRENRLAEGIGITYGDLVRQYVRLNQAKEPFARIPHARYINFMSDFLQAEKDATRERAIKAWNELKMLDAPKTYRAWKLHQSAQ